LILPSPYNDRTVKRLLLVAALAAGLASSLPGAITKITVDAPIHPITAEYITRSLDRAAAAGDRLVLLALNTPGGLDSSMREIITAIVNSPVPVATWVSPSGARAASAGFFIGIASDLFIMAPGTSTGAAHPVGISLTGQGLDATMAAKVTEDAASYMKSLAEKRGRNVAAAEAAVRQSASYTETEALAKGLIDLVAKNEDEISEALNGRALTRFSGERQSLDLRGETVSDRPMSGRQRFLLTISNPNLAYILLMIGLLGLYFEFAHPGAILPGALGGISLLLAAFAFQILPINYVGLLLILLSIGLFILEVKVNSFGVLAAGGIAAMIIGSLMLVNSPVPALRPSLGVILPVALGLSLIFILLFYLVFKAHSRRALTGKEGLIGEVGRARTDLVPDGQVFVHGEIWRAEAEAPIVAGSRVRVVKVLDSLKLRVEKS